MNHGDANSARHVLAVLPSEGLGGGIERYADAVLVALRNRGVAVEQVAFHRVDQPASWLKTRVRFARDLRRAAPRLRASTDATVLVFHPSLLLATVALLRLARVRRARRIAVIYCQEIWGLSRVERRVLPRLQVRWLAISSFTAGVAAPLGLARLLPPGFVPEWYELLSSTPRPERQAASGTRLLTVFRLPDADVKGVYTLLAACDLLATAGVPAQLCIAGAGRAPHRLRAECADRAWVSLVESPSDRELARLYANADVFVLATRTSTVKPIAAEGFGIVLAEAQLCGAAVVAPASGGGTAAFVDGVTGVAPVDESFRALAQVLQDFVRSPSMLRSMGSNAAIWARRRFDPARYGDTVMSIIFDEPASGTLPLVIEPLAESEV
jgi:phosphatidyl-myo-inositol dimannoside synthase